jgi:hypothetical protein
VKTKLLTRYFIAIGIFSVFISLAYLGVRFRASDFTVATVMFDFWLMSPYIVWAFINERRPDSFSKHPRLYLGFAIGMPIMGAGVVGYVSCYPDPQAGVYFFYLTFIQLMCLWVVWRLCKKC